jgi:hypothetical protein
MDSILNIYKHGYTLDDISSCTVQGYNLCVNVMHVNMYIML